MWVPLAEDDRQERGRRGHAARPSSDPAAGAVAGPLVAAQHGGDHQDRSHDDQPEAAGEPVEIALRVDTRPGA
jgi:hypothetical protein